MSEEIIDGMLDVTSFDQLTAESIDRLGVFNAEEARGIVHTEDYRKRMAKLQDRFNRQPSVSIEPRFNPRRKYWWQR